MINLRHGKKSLIWIWPLSIKKFKIRIYKYIIFGYDFSKLTDTFNTALSKYASFSEP